MTKSGVAVLAALSLIIVAGAVSMVNWSDNKILHPDRNTYEIPDWVKNNAHWWIEGHISDNEFSYSLEYLIEQDIIKTKKCKGECGV